MGEAEQSEIKIAGRGVFFLGFQGAAYSLFVLLLYVAMVRLLPQSTVGVVFALQSVGSLASVASSGWLLTSATRFVADALGRSDLKGARQWYSTSLGVSFLTGAGAALVLYAAAPEISHLLFASASWTGVIRLYSLDYFLMQISIGSSSALQGRSRFGSTALVYTAYGALKLGIGVPLLLLGFGIYSIVYAWIVADLFQFVVYLFLSRDLVGRALRRNSLRGLLAFGLPLILLSSFSVITSNIDRLAILKIGGTSPLAVYGSMLAAAGAVGSVLGAVANSALPSFSRLNARGSLSADAVSVAFRYYLIAALPLVGVAAGISEPLVRLVLGAAYLSGWPAFSIVVSAVGIVSFAGIFANAFYGKGDSRTPVRIQVLSGAFFAACVIPLIFFYGVTGAAAAYVAANLLSVSLLARALSKKSLFKLESRFVLGSLATYAASLGTSFGLAFLTAFSGSYILLDVIGGLFVAAALTKGLKILTADDAETIASVMPLKLRSYMRRVVMLLV